MVKWHIVDGYFSKSSHMINSTRRFFIARNSSCGKVMFSQACAKNSVHRGRGRSVCQGCLPRGCLPIIMGLAQGGCLPRVCVHPWGVYTLLDPEADTPPRPRGWHPPNQEADPPNPEANTPIMTIEVKGTQPTGMHSCIQTNFNQHLQFECSNSWLTWLRCIHLRWRYLSALSKRLELRTIFNTWK